MSETGSPTLDHSLAALVTHLRQDADFNRSWIDGRRRLTLDEGSPAAYRERRKAVADQREAWANKIDALQIETDELKAESAELTVVQYAASALRSVLIQLRDRDDQNGSLPPSYRIPIDEVLAASMPAGLTFDLIQHLHRQRTFSTRTFGPGHRSQMVIDHIRKELVEVEAKPTALMEWVDVILLALDGAWRAGFEPSAIASGIMAKQVINEGRKWPDWRTADPTRAIEHVRVQIADDDAEACIACAVPFVEGDMVLHDINGGCTHAACCSPESYVDLETGEPLPPGSPAPEPFAWTPDLPAKPKGA